MCLAIIIGAIALHKNIPAIKDHTTFSQAPRIQPDYTNTVIPPNIAPLNFMIQNDAAGYLVKIHSANGQPIEIYTRTGKVEIPIRKWRSLLDSSCCGKPEI